MSELTDTHRRAALRGRKSVASFRIKSGVYAARIFAAVVGLQTALAVFVFLKITDWMFTDQPFYSGLPWIVIIFLALCNGVWGTYSLAHVKRDALLVPPAPLRNADQWVVT